jgi:hypothetical protein
MARPRRIEHTGGFYHVTSHGDRREASYHGDQDRVDRLAVRGKIGTRFNGRCHTYGEMTNHYYFVYFVYFVVETPDANPCACDPCAVPVMTPVPAVPRRRGPASRCIIAACRQRDHSPQSRLMPVITERRQRHTVIPFNQPEK